MKTSSTAFHFFLMVSTMSMPFGLLADEARDMQPDGRLSLQAQADDFVLVGHDEDRLLIISPEGQAVQPAIGGDISHWSLRFDALQAGDGEPRLIEIRLPHSAELEFRLGQGSLLAKGLHGPLIQLQVIGGSVTIQDSNPDRLFVETVEASQSLASLAREETRLQSVGGDIRARGQGKRLALQTVSGQVRLDIDQLLDLDLQSLSGDTQVRVRPAERAVLRARSNSAPLAFELPADLPLDLRAESHSGTINSDFGGRVEVDQNGNRRLNHGAGPGAVRLDLRSIEGSISVGKRVPQAELLVFHDDPSRNNRRSSILRSDRAGARRVRVRGGIAVGIDQLERISLRPGQFSVLELPRDSQSIFARGGHLEPLVLAVEEIQPIRYCFRLSTFQRFREVAEFTRGFKFEQVNCPDPEFLADFEQVGASPHG